MRTAGASPLCAMLLSACLGVGIARADISFPEGYGAGFPIEPTLEWTGPNLEPVLEYGLKFKIVRMDGEKKSGSIGPLRDWYLDSVEKAGWPVPSHYRKDTIDRFEAIFFRKHGEKLQYVDLTLFRQGELVYAIVKAYRDRKLVVEWDPAKVTAWHLPKDYSDDFPVFPFAQPKFIGTREIKLDFMSTEAVEGRVEAVVPDYSLREVRNWYLGRLKEDFWPEASIYTRDDDDEFQHAFIRSRDKTRMAVNLEIKRQKPEWPVELTLTGQPNTFTQLDDEAKAKKEAAQASAKKEKDPAKLIEDIDPADPDIDFIETPRGWGAGFPVHPDTQFIQGKLKVEKILGATTRIAVIEGVLLELTVTEAAEWFLKAANEQDFTDPGVYEEDEADLFKTRFQRKTPNTKQNVVLIIHTRPQDGYTQFRIEAAEDWEVESDPDMDQMIQMPN